MFMYCFYLIKGKIVIEFVYFLIKFLLERIEKTMVEKIYLV